MKTEPPPVKTQPPAAPPNPKPPAPKPPSTQALPDLRVSRIVAGQFFSAFERWRPEAPEEKIAAPPARSFLQLLWRTLLRLLGLRRDD